jgi:hypothetical protein
VRRFQVIIEPPHRLSRLFSQLAERDAEDGRHLFRYIFPHRLQVIVLELMDPACGAARVERRAETALRKAGINAVSDFGHPLAVYGVSLRHGCIKLALPVNVDKLLKSFYCSESDFTT